MAATTSEAERAAMERNLRILPWWWVIRWVWLAEAIWVIYLIQERGLTIGEVFIFEAVYQAIGIVAEVPTGIVADRYGRRISMMLASAITTAAFVAFGLASTIPFLIGSFALFALGDAFMSGADNAFVFDTLQRLGRSDQFARRIGRLNAMQTAVIALFTVAGAALAHRTALSVPIVLSGILTLPAVFLAFMLTEPPHRGERASFLRTGTGAVRRVARARPMWLMILLMTFGGLPIALMGTTVQPVIVGYGVPLWTLGLFISAQLALSSASAWSASSIGRLLGLRRTLWAMGVLSTVALFGGASGLIWLFPLFIMPSVSWQVLHVHVTDFLARRSPARERATVLSIDALTWRVVSIPVSLLMAAVIDRSGLGIGLAGAGAALLVAVIATHVAWARSGDTEMEPAVAPEER
jgi:MFS family permease